jgi:hypothetical protein
MPQLSLVVTGAIVYVLLATLHNVTFGGQLTTGAVLSTTVIVCVQLLVLPLLSVTVHTTLVAPGRNWAGALLVTEATPQLSLVLGLPRFTLLA